MLRAARDELSLLISNTGTPVFQHIPRAIVPPVVMLEPGTPYIEEGTTFCDFTVRMNAVVLASQSDNEVATDELDTLICDVLDAVDTWTVDSVEQPSPFEINGATYLGARIRFSTDKTL